MATDLPSRLRPVAAAARIAALVAVAAGSLPAFAVYKVVGPDGKITYTDQPPNEAAARQPAATAPAPGDGGAAAAATLPLELRGPAARYPVTLYTADRCDACDAARQMLVARGVPYAERRVLTPADADALAARVGGRTVPAVTIGGQALLGYVSTDWNAYLDAAGYPKQSVLPPTYRQPAPQPLTPPRPAPAEPAPPAPAEAAAPPPQPLPPPPAPGGIRF